VYKAYKDILLLILLFIITLIQDIYNYLPETNHDCRVYNVVGIVWLQYTVHVMLFPEINVLYFYISNFRNMFAVPNMAVFCSSLMSCFAGMFYYYYYYYYYYLWLCITSSYILRLCINEYRYFCVRTILNQRYIFSAPRQVAPAQGQIPFSGPTVYAYFSSPTHFAVHFFVGKKVSPYPIFCRLNCTSVTYKHQVFCKLRFALRSTESLTIQIPRMNFIALPVSLRL
jgi:hypothetical protein